MKAKNVDKTLLSNMIDGFNFFVPFKKQESVIPLFKDFDYTRPESDVVREKRRDMLEKSVQNLFRSSKSIPKLLSAFFEDSVTLSIVENNKKGER